MVGVAIRVDRSYSYRDNIRIVLIFANLNSTRIINVSTFTNLNPTSFIIRVRQVSMNMTNLI